MDFDIWIIYLLASAALCFTPGPNTLLALTHGASHGVQKSLFTSLGGAAGFTLVIAICMAGLGALLSTSALAFAIVKWIGAGYLIYLGIVTWRSPPLSVQRKNQVGTAKRRKLFFQGFMAAASNPKGIVFFAAFLPQFIDPASSQLIQFAVLASTFVSIEFLLELGLAGSASRLAPWLGKNAVGRWFNRITGASFVGIGGLLAAANR
ncbi:LysE family translocator [Pelagibius sp. Alg239-R121]|uniref:LysE family translocator n=1 Tax=Pelagibius sp. Alg239-R121 TaxID=2993448 RepID=UPI0024A71559|nr:LysE family transporter [Pelagibius sp. Alg239-R121]